MDNDKKKIIDYARERFLTDGFYKISMDEISKELKISKKTIYKHFESKDVLVHESIFSFVKNLSSKISEITESDENAVIKFYFLINLIINNINKFSHKFLSDLQIHSPSIWADMNKFREEVMNANLTKILIQGQSEGYFKDLPPYLAVSMIIAAAGEIVSPKFLLKHPLSYDQTVSHMFEIFFQGILTPKGLRIYRSKKERISI
ncbi:MAG TPA: TetR/AcrR family transcriptional regulator [Ignavibacteriaceae bacterium]|nr:TetR/AcrR family transcriptional regulator [Ignavibacteriaceae bacterium]